MIVPVVMEACRPSSSCPACLPPAGLARWLGPVPGSPVGPLRLAICVTVPVLLVGLMLVLRLLWQPRLLANRPGPGRRPSLARLRRAPGRRAAPQRVEPDPSPRWRETLRSMVEDQSDDLWGLAFLLLGVLAGLGIYAEVIGPAGHVLRTGTGDVLGLARYGLPPAFAVLGGYLIWRHERSEPGRVAHWARPGPPGGGRLARGHRRQRHPAQPVHDGPGRGLGRRRRGRTLAGGRGGMGCGAGPGGSPFRFLP